MFDKEMIIRKYFNMWLTQNGDELSQIFDDDIYYSECYGPEYHGIEQIKQWFFDWNSHGRVIRWDINSVVQQGNTCVAEWYFECEYDGVTDGFNGVTLAQFSTSGKIVSIKEFQSKAEHCSPYGKKEC